MSYELIKKQEAAKTDFALMLNNLLEEKGLSYTDLARLSKKSKSQISRIMGGDTNMTVETMVILTDAIGEDLLICVRSDFSRNVFKWVEQIQTQSATVHIAKLPSFKPFEWKTPKEAHYALST